MNPKLDDLDLIMEFGDSIKLMGWNWQHIGSRFEITQWPGDVDSWWRLCKTMSKTHEFTIVLALPFDITSRRDVIEDITAVQSARSAHETHWLVFVHGVNLNIVRRIFLDYVNPWTYDVEIYPLPDLINDAWNLICSFMTIPEFIRTSRVSKRLHCLCDLTSTMS